ncbi:MAG: TonB-dependent receptor plug domain-containing protein [Luteitalea sp.]|nr:TonB-dependent receptor plug domain-containing protein [Luteitalea sp.]
MNTRHLVLMKLVLALLVGPISEPARAQTSAEGSVRGYVKDEQGATLPGVTLTATSLDVPGTRTAVSDETGYYRLDNLPPATYAITSELEGFAKYVRDNIVVRAGLNLGLEIVMRVGDITETVTVTPDTPMLESSSAVQAVNISGEFQRGVPLSGRKHWADFMRMVPGTIESDSSVYQGGFYYVHGANSASNSIQIDGVDIASSQQATPVYIGLNNETIADVQIKTAAFDAASPLAQGTVTNVATQSGTNELRGAGGLAFMPLRWIGDNTPGGTSTRVAVIQPDFALGGPIKRDRLWFFGSYRRVYNDATIFRTAEQVETLRALDPSFTPFNNVTEASVYFVKATAQLSPRHQSYVFYNYDFMPAGHDGATALVPGLWQWIGGTAIATRISSVWTDSLTTRVAVGYNDKAYESGSITQDQPQRAVHESAFLSSGRLTGSGIVASVSPGGYRRRQPYDKLSISADAMYYKRGWVGSHEIQTGLLLQRNHQATSILYPADGVAFEELVMREPTNPAAGLVPFRRQVYDGTLNVRTDVNFSDYGAYIQNAWRPTPRLTINAGVRMDMVRRRDQLIDVQVQDSLEVGPRFSVNYLLTEDRRDTVRASWSRVHETPSNNLASGATNTMGVTDFYDNDLDGVFELELRTPGGTQAPVDRVIDPDYHQPYFNEWTVGYRRQLPGQATVDIAFIRRGYRDRSTLVDENGIYDDGVFRGYRNPELNEMYRLTNNQWNWPMYSSLEAQATKQTDRWQVLSSVSRQWRHIAGTWQPNDPASFIQPSAFSNDNGIGAVSSPTSVAQDGNSLSGTHMAGSSNLALVDYVVRMAAAVRAPGNILVATNYMVRAGLWSGPIVTRTDAPDPRFGPATVILSNGRVASNPLATTVRFAYPTRGEGQFKSPTVHSWNLRLGREFAVGARRRLEAMVDVFNVTNLAADESSMLGSNQRYSPNYGLFSDRQQPRAVQMSLRVLF